MKHKAHLIGALVVASSLLLVSCDQIGKRPPITADGFRSRVLPGAPASISQVTHVVSERKLGGGTTLVSVVADNDELIAYLTRAEYQITTTPSEKDIRAVFQSARQIGKNHTTPSWFAIPEGARVQLAELKRGDTIIHVLILPETKTALFLISEY